MVDSPKKRQEIEYSQAFNELWLEDDQLKDWISESDDPYKTLCKYCKVTFNQPKKDNLLRHRATKTHERAVAASKGF